MGLLLGSFLLELGLVAAAVAVYLYKVIKEKYRYFEERGIPFLKPALVGDTVKALIGVTNVGEAHKAVYDKLKGHKIGGFYQVFTPFLSVRDPEMIHRVLIKDFSHFHDRGVKIDEENNPLEGHLFLLSGDKWRALRAKLSPTFTSGKLRWMFSQLDACADSLLQLLEVESAKGDVEAKDLLARFTTDVIGSCVFGLEPESIKDPDCKFRIFGREVFTPDLRQIVAGFLRFAFPNFFFKLKIKTVPPHIDKFFTKVIKDTLEERRRSGRKRNDFVQLLLQLKDKGTIEADPREHLEEEEDDQENQHLKHLLPATDLKFEMTDEVLTAQAFVFFAAGFETSATALSFTFYFLAKHREKQDKAREEVRQVKEKHGGRFTYDALKEMTYVENCFKEATRLFPPIPVLFRECTKAITFDSGITVEKGVNLVIQVSGLHMDPEVYKNPEEYRPERFDEGEGTQPGTFLPFGDGPRICIGKRFAVVEVKLAMAKILDNYSVELSPKLEEPIKLNPRAFVNQPLNGLWLKFKKLPTK